MRNPLLIRPLRPPKSSAKRSSRSAKYRIERRGKLATGFCIAVVAALVIVLIAMVTARGVATFTTDGIPVSSFFAGTIWNPHTDDANGIPLVGALPMICGSFLVTLLSCAIALPFALGCSIFVIEIAPRFGERIFRPLSEVLVGIPSVVFGLIGLTIVVPFMRSLAGGTGFGILAGSLVLAFMIFPTITSLTTDALAAVPHAWRDGSYALGCTRWQTIAHVVLPSAVSGVLTAVVLGMARAFGEALAVQMVIGNAAQMPRGLFTPAATLTSVLTMGMGNEAMGTVYSDALWSLALVLLAMSLLFILIVHLIGRRSRVVANG